MTQTCLHALLLRWARRRYSPRRARDVPKRATQANRRHRCLGRVRGFGTQAGHRSIFRWSEALFGKKARTTIREILGADVEAIRVHHYDKPRWPNMTVVTSTPSHHLERFNRKVMRWKMVLLGRGPFRGDHRGLSCLRTARRAALSSRMATRTSRTVQGVSGGLVIWAAIAANGSCADNLSKRRHDLGRYAVAGLRDLHALTETVCATVLPKSRDFTKRRWRHRPANRRAASGRASAICSGNPGRASTRA